MNLVTVDWVIVVAVLAIMAGGVWASRAYMRSVADFLAAGRTAGRYLLTVSQGVAGLGAISVVGFLEQNYVAGFTMMWWGLTMALVVLIVTASGWIIYRFRETRCLTLAEFFERRYSRNFRVFAGIVAFLSGIVNFGIFPAVGARFFITFIGLPSTVQVLGMRVPMFPLVMLVLLSIALFFVFSGGHVAVIIADFVQGTFVNVVFLVIVVYLLGAVDFGQMAEVLSDAPANASLINPFETGDLPHFNFWFFLIGVLIVVYGAMSWQGTQAYNTSARSAHEAKMGQILSNWRAVPQNLFLVLVPVAAYTVLRHPAFASSAADVASTMASQPTETLRNQLRVPAVMLTLFPAGLMGAFAAVMLAAFISTHDTYLHSWGSIFVQDVIMPFRSRPFRPDHHVRVLRASIVGVALFVFLFSLLFQQSQYIFLFFAITGAVFFGGSGAVLIGGLYWKRGTTAAAWAAMLTGSGIATGGIVLHQLRPGFPIDGQVFSAIAIGAAVLVYVSVSLAGPRREFDLDRLLHRGTYAVADDGTTGHRPTTRILRWLGMGREFTRGDRVILLLTYAWTLGWVAVFVIGTVLNVGNDVPDSAWMGFWRVWVYVQLAAAVAVVVWFTLGGVRDIRDMLRRLRGMTRDPSDDGYVTQSESHDAPAA